MKKWKYDATIRYRVKKGGEIWKDTVPVMTKAEGRDVWKDIKGEIEGNWFMRGAKPQLIDIKFKELAE